MAISITQSLLTKNDVYTNNLGRIDDRYRKFQDEGPKGLMIHSTGTPQPRAEVYIKSWNKPGVEKATHAFIEPNAIYQTLPWNYRGWHAGGTANNTHIGVEMTEPKTIKYTGGSSWVDLDPKATEAHVRATYANAVELFANLCKEFNLDPLADGVIISHAEGHKRGIASNHGDPEHIWKKFGLSMGGFRVDVAAKMKPVQTKLYSVTIQGLAKSVADNLAKAYSDNGYEVSIEEMTEPVAEPWVPAVGDVVLFTGNAQYTSSQSSSAKKSATGQAKITAISKGAKHPYHLIRTGKSGPYGWVDKGTFKKA